MTDSNLVNTAYDNAYKPFDGGYAFEQSHYNPQADESHLGCTDLADKPNDQSSFEYDAFNYKYD